LQYRSAEMCKEEVGEPSALPFPLVRWANSSKPQTWTGSRTEEEGGDRLEKRKKGAPFGEKGNQRAPWAG